MIKLNSKEKYLFLILVVVILFAIFYKKIGVKPVHHNVYEKYQRLLADKDKIYAKDKLLFANSYWKKTVDEQKIELERMVTQIAARAGIKNIKNIYPLNPVDKKDYLEIGLQMSFETDINSLMNFIDMLEKINLPIKLTKLKIYEGNNSSPVLKVEVQILSLYLKSI